MELERIYGVRKGSSNEKGINIGHQDNLDDGKTQNDIANQLQIRPLETIEGEINFYKQQTALGIMEIGRRLIEAKEQLKEEESFKTWCKKMDFGKSTAYKFIKVAKEFDGSVQALGQTKIFALLDLPQSERDELISDTHEVNGETKTVDDMTT